MASDGQSFVTVVADTSRTGDDLETDLDRILQRVERELDNVDVNAAMASGSQDALQQRMQAIVRDISRSVGDIEVDGRLSDDAQRVLAHDMRAAMDRAMAVAGDLQFRVDAAQLRRDTNAAVRTAQTTAPDIDVDVHADPQRLKLLASAFVSIGSTVGRVGASMLKMGGALASVGSLAAGLVATLEQIAPAAAVGVSALLAVALTTATVKLATAGMGDAISAAFATGKGSAEKYAEALKKLAPNARAFVKELHSMAPALKEFQQGVQNRFFDGFDNALERLSKTVLPTLRTGVNQTAGTLNKMALGAANAASKLGSSGVLGQAIAGANKGLTNLSGLPAQIVTGLGQIGAAAAPAFDLITSKLGSIGTDLSSSLAASFKSGGLETAINQAVSTLGQLVDVAKNLGTIFTNTFGQAASAGGGLIGTLEEITGAIADATSDPAIQEAFSTLFETMGALASTVGPLLGAALKALAPVISTLGPPLQTLIGALGDALMPIVEALGPVLTYAADAVGQLGVAIAPMLVTLGELVAALLPALIPLFTTLANIFTQLAPMVQLNADLLTSILAPILAELPAIIAPLMRVFQTLVTTLLPVILQIMTQLAPVVGQLATVFAQLLVAVAPLVAAFLDLVVKGIATLLPVLTPLISLVATLAGYLTDALTYAINNMVIPAVQVITALFKGDFSGAMNIAKEAIATLVNRGTELMRALPGKAASAISSLASQLRAKVSEASHAVSVAVAKLVTDAVAKVRTLPGRARDALGNLGLYLAGSGRALIQGFVNGIKSMTGVVAGAVSGVLSEARKYLPFSPAKEGPFSGRGWTLYSGRSLMDGMAQGIGQRAGTVSAAMRDALAGAQPGAFGMPAMVGVGTARSMAAGSVGPVSTSVAAPNVNVFIGGEPINSMIDVRVGSALRTQGQRLMNGPRR